MSCSLEAVLDRLSFLAGDKKTVKFGRNIRVQKDIWTEVGAVIPVPEGNKPTQSPTIIYILVVQMYS